MAHNLLQEWITQTNPHPLWNYKLFTQFKDYAVTVKHFGTYVCLMVYDNWRHVKQLRFQSQEKTILHLGFDEIFRRKKILFKS